MILVDDREPKEIIDKLRQRMPVKICRLLVGDYVIGEIVIERKTQTDLFNSANDNRLWNQLLLISKTYPKACLLFEGIVSPKTYGIMNYAAAKYGVFPLYAENVQKTSTLISSLFVLNNKPASNILSPPKCKILPAQVGILSQFPGIGRKTAKELLCKFGNLSNIFNASRTELKEVLGRKRRVAFYKTLKEELKEAFHYRE